MRSQAGSASPNIGKRTLWYITSSHTMALSHRRMLFPNVYVVILSIPDPPAVTATRSGILASYPPLFLTPKDTDTALPSLSPSPSNTAPLQCHS